MHIETHFGDDRYTLASFQAHGANYVLLHDADQRSSFLGRDEGGADLALLWRRHLEDEAYCIPCELMLHFEEQWIAVAGEMPLEMGIDTGAAQRLIGLLREDVPALADVALIQQESHR